MHGFGNRHFEISFKAITSLTFDVFAPNLILRLKLGPEPDSLSKQFNGIYQTQANYDSDYLHTRQS